jgi:hypothetical protein
MTLRYNISIIRFEVLTVVNSEIVIFWYVTLAVLKVDADVSEELPAPLELKFVWRYQ